MRRWLEKQKLNNVQTKSTIIRGRDIKTDSDLKKCQACPEDVDNGITRWDMQVYAHKPKDGVLSIISNVGSDTVFWLVTALCFVILGVRMLFRHLDATFPQYMERELGDDVKLGAVFSMNPLAVVIFLIFLAPLFSNADVMYNDRRYDRHSSCTSLASYRTCILDGYSVHGHNGAG